MLSRWRNLSNPTAYTSLSDNLGPLLSVFKCKICDVRDYATARMCAELGADFLGLHSRHLDKRDRKAALVEVVDRIREEFPEVGLVAVTQTTSLSEIRRIVAELRPTHLQLHAPEWTADRIQRLRNYLQENDIPQLPIIAVGEVPITDDSRVRGLCKVADFLLLDRNLYAKPEKPSAVPPEVYGAALAVTASTPTLIAGGLTPQNVRAYLRVARPWGVDVQRGVEEPGPGGRKDPEKVKAFIEAARSVGIGLAQT